MNPSSLCSSAPCAQTFFFISIFANPSSSRPIQSKSFFVILSNCYFSTLLLFSSSFSFLHFSFLPPSSVCFSISLLLQAMVSFFTLILTFTYISTREDAFNKSSHSTHESHYYRCHSIALHFFFLFSLLFEYAAISLVMFSFPLLFHEVITSTQEENLIFMLQDFAFYIVVLDVEHKNWIKRTQNDIFQS